MEATITTIGNVFKQQVKHNTIVPTIWVDVDGVEHEDKEHEAIGLQVFSTDPNTGASDCAYIKQVGSIVKHADVLCTPEYASSFTDLIDLKNLFAYAINLEEAVRCFLYIGSITELPENLFWNCPKLSSVANCFFHSGLTTIPEGLFEKSSNLKDASLAFANCYDLTVIPENLFSNCPNLETIYCIFYKCLQLKDVPDRMFRSNKNLTEIDHAFRSTQTYIRRSWADQLERLSDEMYQDLLNTKAIRPGMTQRQVSKLLFTKD